MQLLSIVRTREHSALTISGLDLAGDIDVRVAPGTTYNLRPALSVGSPAGTVAIAVGRAGRAGVLFSDRDLRSAANPARWSRRMIEAAISHEDLDEAAYQLADRLLADDRDSFSALLAEYEQCHTVRFSGRGQPYVTTVRGNYGLLSFWNEYPGLTIAEEAYAKFERWVEAGLRNPLGLQPFHILDATEIDPGERPRDVAQIQIRADRQSADVHLWTAPKAESARPMLSMSVPLHEEYLVIAAGGTGRPGNFSELGNFSQIDPEVAPRLRDMTSGQH